MPCPTKRKGSDNWYFRRTIPADVQRILAKLPKENRPRGWYKTHISISLGTADRALAKAKCPEVTATVEQQMKALREGPKPLTQKQIAALSGLLYKAFTEGLEEDPVLSPEQWQNVAEMNRDARSGKFGRAPLLIIEDEAERRAASMEQRFGPMVDAFLAGQAIVTDEDSRWMLIERLSIDLSQAAEKLARNADGDYTPDEYAHRFPRFVAKVESKGPRSSLTSLLEAWHVAALTRMKKRDADRMKARTEKFIAFLEHDDVERTTADDVIRWAEHRRKKASYKTVNNSDLASIKNVFNWAVGKKLISTNPAYRITADGRKRARLREPYFVQGEIVAILGAALRVTGSAKEHPKTTAAKRWVPWLCAYSGARVGEMLQLRKQDVRNDHLGWVIRLTPEAGNIKNDEYRDVPVHEDLIRQGFIDFVQGSATGPLFCSLGADGTISGPIEGVYQRVRMFVREHVPDKKVQPSHAWRYTFKTIGVETGIAPLVLDAICGHAPKTQGDEYSRITLRTRMEAMASFPRYELQPSGGTEPPSDGLSES